VKRHTVVVAHLLALPMGTLLSLALGPVLSTDASRHAAETALHDTYFVVAHVHIDALLGSCLAVTTLVAHLYGRLNWALAGAWGLFVLHGFAALFALGPAAPGTGAFRMNPASHPGLGYLYIGSALALFLAVLLSLIISLAGGLQRQGMPPA
jgi:hypothetical protein